MSKKKIVELVIVIILIVFLTGAFIIYLHGASYYKTRFFAGTKINGIDCSDLEPNEVITLIDGQIRSYVLEVWGRNPSNPEETAVLARIRPEDVDLAKKETASFVNNVFSWQDPYSWVKAYFGGGRVYDFDQEVTFDHAKLKDLVNGLDACSDQVAQMARDAYLSEYLPETGRYEVISETIGGLANAEKILPAIEKALFSMEKRVDIEETGCYNSAKVKADDKTLNELADQVNLWLGASISYNWFGTEFIVDHKLIKDWVSLKDGAFVLDEDAITKFVADAKKKYDPQGNTYTFHTSLGADLELEVKTGWISDEVAEAKELIDLIRQGAVTDKRPVSQSEDYVYFDGTVGGSYAEVDVTNQHLYFYYQGELYLETDCVTGDMASKHDTPQGIFAVTGKYRDRILRGPGYESFVHYWMPFYGGYGMHDAMWRRTFGGNIYLRNGSHGCVNLPLKKAKEIFAIVEKGFPVVVYYYPEGKNPKDAEAIETAGNAQAGGQANGNEGSGAQDTINAGEAHGTSDVNGEVLDGEKLTEENEIQGQW